MSEEKKSVERVVKVTILVDAEDSTLCAEDCPGAGSEGCGLFPLDVDIPRTLEAADHNKSVRCRKCLAGEIK